MPSASETRVQAFIHALEQTGWVAVIRFVLLLAAVGSVYVIVILTQFNGLSHPAGMDQAQVGRQLASGLGFTTKFIRPAAFNQLSAHLGRLPAGDLPDTYNSPLNPWLDSILLKLARDHWEMKDTDLVFPMDRLIAAVALFCFILSTGVNYLTMRRLFDARLALLATSLVLVCRNFWAYSLTGLPQMLMLLVFSLVTHCMARAIAARNAGRTALPWLGLTGAGFGLMTLAHGLTAWIFLGALVYIGVAFPQRAVNRWLRPILHPVWLTLALAMAVEAPWMLRLYNLTGSPFGVALYGGLGQLFGGETRLLRASGFDSDGYGFIWFNPEVQRLACEQLASLYAYLGRCPVALVFFLALLHIFKRPETDSFRWGILSMWIFAWLGMSLAGLPEAGPVHANDLHVLFIPMTIAYGLAFVLVLWTRLSTERPEMKLLLVRWGAYGLLLLVSAFPLADMLFTGGRLPIQWPPYYPWGIVRLEDWVHENEITVSDMPWAVAWYAGRKSLWLPETVAEFMDIYDNGLLVDPIVAMYLTPVSGDAPFISQIEKGEYREWAPFILRTINSHNFPLPIATALPLGGQCIIYTDRDHKAPFTDRDR